MNDTAFSTAKGTKASVWSFRLAMTGLVLIVVGLVGARGGASPFIAMLLVSLGSLSLIIGGITGAVGLIRSRGTGGDASSAMTWIALLLGVAAVVNASTMMRGGGAPIHDISTDTADPPAFVAVAELRSPGDNPAEYAGAETASLQAAAYPDIETIVVLDPASFVFDQALATAEQMGWEIVAADANEGRIEATATTTFVGFKDDVVIRVRAKGAETLVDVRSKSRVGKGDMGVNAQRIRDFQASFLANVNP